MSVLADQSSATAPVAAQETARADEWRRRYGELAQRRARVSLLFSIVAIAMYFGFMTMFAFAKPTLGMVLMPGLTLCILLGASVIVGSIVLCLAYVVWANTVYDPAVAAMTIDAPSAGSTDLTSPGR